MPQPSAEHSRAAAGRPQVPIPPPPTDPSGPRPTGRNERGRAGGAGADAGGRHRGAGRRRAAARSRRARDVRDVGHRHRQVAGRHLQRAARRSTTRPPRRWRSGCPSAPRAPITAEDVKTAPTIEALADHRARAPRGRRARRLRARRCARRQEGSDRPSRCSCSTRRAVRRWCTSRCSSGCRRTPRCTASSGSRAPSRSAPREYVPKLLEMQRQRAVHPGRLVAGRRAGLRVRDRAASRRAPTCGSSG